MYKKIIIGIIIILILITVGIILSNRESNSNIQNVDDITDNDIQNSIIDNDKNYDIEKSAVIYFSATGNTKQIAEYISEITDSDIIEIIPKEEYTEADLSYNNDDCRANVEQNNSTSRPEISNTIEIDNYEIIYLGYPIWWGDVPKIILTLLDNYNFDGKTVIPFCTSGSTGITQSMNTLKTYNEDVNWIDGKRFSSSSNKNDVESWINDLEIEN